MTTFAIMTENAVRVQGPPQGAWTAEDWERLEWETDERYEIIEGMLYVSKSPSGFHQWALIQLAIRLGGMVLDKGLGYPFFAPIGVFMPGCEPVQPDFVVVTAARKDIIRDRRIYGVPDLIIEVLSPGNRVYDEDTKRRAYQRCGVPEYGMLDLLERRLRLFSLGKDGTYGEARIFKQDDIVSFACLPGINIRLNILFDGAPDTTL
jgi:Uma2 family endonuclease